MTPMDHDERFGENSEKFLKKILIFGVLIEQAKGFNLRRMRVLRSHKLKNYYVITKKLRQKS